MAVRGLNRNVMTRSKAGAFVNWLQIPTNGAADVPVSNCKGSFVDRITSIVYAANAWTITFKSGFVWKDGTVFAVRAGNNGTLYHATSGTISRTNRTVKINFFDSTGAAAAPPAANADNVVILIMLAPQ